MTANAALAELKLPSIIGDHMVLQRESRVALWGWASPGTRMSVRASWSDAEATATAGADGAWRVDIATPAAGGPFEIAIEGDGARVLKDVLVGEVWLCSGQSNMEWPLNRTEQTDKFLPAADHPQMRLFNVPRTAAWTPQKNCGGQWQACTPTTAAEFTAVGYHYGRILHAKLGVPIGLIGSNWGGTPAESWTRREALRPRGAFDADLRVVDRFIELGPAEVQRLAKQREREWWHAVGEIDSKHGGAHAMRPNFNDDGWSTVELPGCWENAGLPNYNGVAWYRRSFDLPAGAEAGADGWRITLGVIDNMDTVWINGKQVGEQSEADQWHTARDYAVPAGLLRAEGNVIAVRVVDTGGAGGFTGRADQLALHYGEARASLAGPWKLHATVPLTKLPPRPPASQRPRTATMLYNGMIAPLVPYGLRGAIWYQGESNRPRAEQYRELFPAMIEDWRRQWDRGDFPFYFVQIAPYRYPRDMGQTALLREAQTMTLRLPNTGMAVTMDIGDPADIHPRNKRDVGARLALWALRETYGDKSIIASGPLYKGMATRDGRVVLHFEHADGLRGPSDGGGLEHFTIAGADQAFKPAQARIAGETVEVWSDDVPAPAAVRYCWGAADEGTLFNGAGLPAPSFRTDDWPRPEAIAAD